MSVSPSLIYFPNVTVVAGSITGGGEGEPAALGSTEYWTSILLVLVCTKWERGDPAAWGSIVYILWCSLPGELDSPLGSLCTGVVCFFLVEGDPAPSAIDDVILLFLALMQQIIMVSTRKMRRKKPTTPPTDTPMVPVNPRARGNKREGENNAVHVNTLRYF